MFVGCSGISISAIVNMCNTKYQDFWCVWENLLSFSVPGGTEKIAGLWLARGGSVPRLTQCFGWHSNFQKFQYAYHVYSPEIIQNTSLGRLWQNHWTTMTVYM